MNLPWTEFLYNNSYQESLKMAPVEVLFGALVDLEKELQSAYLSTNQSNQL
jgi:hypothetical protein